MRSSYRQALRSANVVIGIALMALTANTFAQPVDSFSDHLMNRLAYPSAAAYHQRTQRLLVGVDGEVRAMNASGAARVLDDGRIRGSEQSTILRVRVDSARERLWILDLAGVHVFDLAAERRIASVKLPNWFYAGHGTSCLPDLQLDRTGAAFIADNAQPKLWRIDGGNFSVRERSVSLDSHRSLDVGFSALAITEDGEMFAAMAAPGLLWRIDAASSRATNVPLTAPIHGACAIETLAPARSRDFALFVLTAARESFNVRRISMVAAATAVVETMPIGTFPVPAAMLSWGGVLYLAEHKAVKGGWTLNAVHRLD